MNEPVRDDDTVTLKLSQSMLGKLLLPALLVVLPGTSTFAVNSFTSKPAEAEAAAEKAKKAVAKVLSEREAFEQEHAKEIAMLRRDVRECKERFDAHKASDAKIASTLQKLDDEDRAAGRKRLDFYAEKWGPLLERVARLEATVRQLRRTRR